MENAKRINLTQGSILRKMIPFVIPLIAASILQQAFNTADMVVVGHFVGNDAYAAVGSTGTIVGLFVEFFLGFSIGANVVISKFIGNGDKEQSSKAVHTSLALALFCGLLIAVVGVALVEPMLKITQVPDELIADASLYLRIYFAGMPLYMLYNFTSAVFRSMGNTKTPLICLAIGGVLNVALNVFLVVVFDMRVAGVAIATVASNALSFGLLLAVLCREREDVRFSFKKCRIDGGIFVSVIKIGLPSGFLGSVFSISNLCVQSAVNSLGTKVIAASSAASGIEIYVQFIGNAFAQACATFTSQNLGAKKLDRCKKVLVAALSVCMAVTLAISLIVYAFASHVVKIFTLDSEVIELAKRRMIYTLLFKTVQCVMDVTVGGLQGYGKTLIPACISMIGVCGLRLVWIFTGFLTIKTIDAIFIVYPITWFIASICDVAYFIRCYKNSKKQCAFDYDENVDKGETA